jgi:hypothetical protein
MKSMGFRALLTIASLVGCNVPSSDARFNPTLPDRDTFREVAPVLAHTCATLDCHGSRSRNLLLYGSEGLRFSFYDRPLSPPCTTNDEIDQDYESVVGLEPEGLTAVVSDRGAHPERLTLVRKARGLESHKGGVIFREGDDSDTCLTSWLAGQIHADACERVMLDTPCPRNTASTDSGRDEP